MADLPPFDPAELVSFWLEAGPQRWFKRDDAFDDQFRSRFLAMHEAAAAGLLAGWRDTAPGALALVLLLDQFPRNAFRDTPRMFATDAQAREVANAALAAGFDQQVDPALRRFFTLPLMHSEQVQDLNRCVALSEQEGGEPLRYALHHREIVERFGRFPHRNAVLGRPSTPEEQRFLAEGGFRG